MSFLKNFFLLAVKPDLTPSSVKEEIDDPVKEYYLQKSYIKVSVAGTFYVNDKEFFKQKGVLKAIKEMAESPIAQAVEERKQRAVAEGWGRITIPGIKN